MSMIKKLRIKCSSFDAAMLDSLCKQIGSSLRGVAKVVSLCALPVKKELININRSGFIYSSSKKQMYQVRHRRCFVIEDFDFVALKQRLDKVHVQPGITLKISFDSTKDV